MHTILFDSYRKFQKENNDNFAKAIFKLPLTAKLLFSGLCLTLLGNLLAIFIPTIKYTYLTCFVCLIFEAVFYISLYFYTDNFQIKNSDTKFTVYQEHCANIRLWLVKIGFVITRENIIELMWRFEKEIDAKEKQRIANKERIEKWIQILIIPIILAVFSAAIKEQTDLTTLFTYAIAFLLVVGFITFAFLSCYGIYDFYKKHKLEQMKSLCNDLQGVLDCQFDEKLFYKGNCLEK